jgi:hypothetical protein
MRRYWPSCACALVFWSLVGFHVPSLRHDWYWPPVVNIFVTLSYVLGGWHPEGIGSLYAYPSDYVVNVAVTILKAVAGSRFAFNIIIVAIAFACASGAQRLTQGVSFAARCALVALALFNPWVYNEIVAGHPFMVLAYGGMMHLYALARERRLGSVQALIAGTCVMPQLQFFVIALASLALCGRGGRVLAFRLAIVALPVWIGIVGDYGVLLQTPYSFRWQIGQAVPWDRAVAMLGYFTRYADKSLASSWWAALWYALALCALAGAISRLRTDVRSRTASACIVVIILIVSAPQTAFSVPYAFLVTHVPQSALYRELYDLVAFITIAYMVLWALAAQRLFAVRLLLPFFALAALTDWSIHPPSHWWVRADSLPAASVHAPPNSRFALVPVFQPLSYRGSGSGIDPDWYPRESNVTPVNDVTAQYPENAALSYYRQTHSMDFLRALSVANVVERRGFVTDARTLAGQLALSRRHAAAFRFSHMPYVPLVSLVLSPTTTSGAPLLGAGDILSWDNGSCAQPANVAFDHSSTLLDQTWTDARLAYISDPRLATPFGGAATDSSRAVLRLSANTSVVLAFVDGALMAEAPGRSWRIVAKNATRYKWISIPKRALLRCLGRCAVALQAQRFPPGSEQPRISPARAISSVAIFPWLAYADAPRSEGVLRFNVRWDAHWNAVQNGVLLPHVRIDGTFNGWRVKRSAAARIYLIHSTSALQFVAEVGSLVYLGIVCFGGLRKRANTTPMSSNVATTPNTNARTEWSNSSGGQTSK